MQFNETDMKILVVTGFTVLIIGATAGATPIGGGFGDMPKFESNAQLDLAPPNPPGKDVSTEGTLRLVPQAERFEESSTIITSNELILRVRGDYNNETGEATVWTRLSQDGGQNFSITHSATLTEGESTIFEIEEIDTGISVDYVRTDEARDIAYVEYNVRYHPNWSEVDGGGGDGLFSAITLIGEWIGYIASLIAYAFDVLFSSIAFTFSVLVDIVTYMFSITTWLIGGFTTMVGSAPIWAAPFIGLPVMLLGLELLKLLLLAVDILWIG